MGVTNKSNTISLYHGKAAKTMPYEIEILDYVLYNRVLGNDVTSNEVIFKLWSIDQTFRLIKILEYTSKWWYRFIKRHFIASEKYSHFSQTSRKLLRQNSRICFL